MTFRELAALQGFPMDHRFHGNDVRRQIGNAVPPLVARKFVEEVRRHLVRVDGERVEKLYGANTGNEI